jgi:hypothetical protein
MPTATTTTTTELESAAACSLLEEMGKRMLSSRGGATLALHGIIRVIAIVEALPQLRLRQHLVRFVHNGHLSFAATLIWVCSKCCLATTKGNKGIEQEANRGT